MIDIELRCGWRVVGTTARPRGLQVHDADGNVVKGVAKVVIEVGVNELPLVTAELLPRLSSESMDPPGQEEIRSWQDADVVSHVEESS